MSIEFNTRRLSADDLVELRDLAEETFLETFASQNEPGNISAYVAATFSAERVAQELANEDSSFYFIETEIGTAGYLKLNRGSAQTEQDLVNALEIERVYVRREFQGTGAGRALMHLAIEIAKAASMAWIWLGVWDQNRKAIEFYKKAGFVEFGQHDFLMGNEVQRDLMMKLALNPKNDPL